MTSKAALPYIEISIRTFEDTRSESFGQKMSQILWEDDDLLVPQKFGPNTRGKRSFSNTDNFMSHWPHDVGTWKRNKKLKNFGFVTHTEQTQGGINPGAFSLHSQYSNVIDWKMKFEKLCSLFNPQLGMMHLYTEFECLPENSTYDFREANLGALWKPSVPGLGWMFAAGERFYKPTIAIDLGNADVQRNDLGNYLTIQIAKSADEIIEDFHTYQNRRDNLISRFPQKYYHKIYEQIQVSS